MDFVRSSPGELGRVVIAEEDPLIAGALSWLLREQGYAVASVTGREQLFASIARATPDLILLDGDVVQRDGDILGQIRSDERYHDVRVIVTAPWAAIEDGAGLPWGVDDCVSKPFRVPELLGRVRTQLRASEQLRAARPALEASRPVLIEDARTHSLFANMREAWAREGKNVEIRSVATVPFSIDRWRSGVLFLRTDRPERNLAPEDITFAEVVIRAAVAAIRRAQALETTRADNRRLEALATTDPLTRVLNRRALLDRLNAEVDRAKRYSSALTLLLLDVDHFKQINDTAGHLAGDSVLRQLGALLEEARRKVDIVARYGGEEFVAILPETSSEGGVTFADRLRERIAEQIFDIGAESPVRLTVSIGIATFPSARVNSTEDLFARADEALYRAKAGGRNQVCA
jgi:diguanylate cyclase (GGDEF)-like protein